MYRLGLFMQMCTEPRLKRKSFYSYPPPYAKVLSALKDPRIVPLDNNTARFFNRLAYDKDYAGIATTNEEGERIAQTFDNKLALMMGNHGV